MDQRQIASTVMVSVLATSIGGIQSEAATIEVGASTSSVITMENSTSNTSSNLDYRETVIGVLGIMNVSTEMSRTVTRGEFTQMLVNASVYKDYVMDVSQVSVYSDVPRDHMYADSIRIAAEQGWVTGYLGGLYKPDQPITYEEATRYILRVLGYGVESAWSRFCGLELNEYIDRYQNELLTKTDCVNLLYNMLKTESNDTGSEYGLKIGCEINSDGEINPLNLVEASLRGPILVQKNSNIGDYVPFNVNEASFYLNGYASSYQSVKNILSNGSYVVIYYNVGAKTIWAYSADSNADDGDRMVVRGTIDSIYYSSVDVMIPTGLEMDGDTFEFDNSEVQFAFSIYGSLRVGDTVVLICEKSEDSSGDTIYTILDYVEY